MSTIDSATDAKSIRPSARDYFTTNKYYRNSNTFINLCLHIQIWLKYKHVNKFSIHQWVYGNRDKYSA